MDDSEKITVVMTVKKARELFGSEVVGKATDKWEKNVGKMNPELPREMQDWK